MAQPAHVYTLHLVRSVFNEEIFQLYQKYEIAIHNKNRTRSDFETFYCNSPLYDPENEPQKADALALPSQKLIDPVWHGADFGLVDQGVYPRALGSYFLLHRIDGKLVGVSSITIARRYMESSYFIYDTDYKHLNLGVVSVVREIEYIRLIQRKYNPQLQFYMLGDIVPTCPKVSYKMNY